MIYRCWANNNVNAVNVFVFIYWVSRIAVAWGTFNSDNDWKKHLSIVMSLNYSYFNNNLGFYQ